jgi:hypothetical protein
VASCVLLCMPMHACMTLNEQGTYTVLCKGCHNNTSVNKQDCEVQMRQVSCTLFGMS